MRDGAMVEIATIGDEGLVGINAFFGAATMTGEAMMQVPDTSAEAMPVKAFRAELDRRGAFYDCVQLYSQGIVMLMMQSTACMALHSVEQRCCRWLLMTHDRVHRDEFQLSHEFLAMMLGSTRPTVTTVAGALQKAGLIKYVHGRITILGSQGTGSRLVRVLRHGQGALRPTWPVTDARDRVGDGQHGRARSTARRKCAISNGFFTSPTACSFSA